MATGKFQMPEVRSFLITSTFNDLFEYGNGIFSLRTSDSDQNRPANATYWMVLQFKMLASGAWFGGQLAINTTTSNIYYMRKFRGSNGWTEWGSLTFS